MTSCSAGLEEVVTSQVEEKISLHQRNVTTLEKRVMSCDDLERTLCPHFKRCTVKQPPRASQPQIMNVDEFARNSASIEASVFEELKNLRFNPSKYVHELQRRRAAVVGSTLWCGGSAVRLAEGPAVIDEAIAALQHYCMSTKVEIPLVLESGLCLAARDLGLDVGPKGLVDQRGTDESTVAERVNRYGSWETTVAEVALFGTKGSDPVDVIAQILINDGVSSRIHQRALLNVNLRHVGICVVPHVKATACVIIVLAQSFFPIPLATKREIHESVPTRNVPQNCCAYCLGELDLKRCVFGIEGKAFHKHCFLCKVCKSTLEDVFFERKGEIHTESLCKSCVMFRAPISCSRCSSRITAPTPQYKCNDNPVCEACFIEMAKGMAEPFPQ
ncbi:Hypothetical protein, putative [Bodo saltans]|uniref:LIM zinc-binding domain-containing protein n=1 Tax=Bodo saltans TaxID=75058 RepID=A0A0S4KQA7_BODSA|nr:Hypothetical protein, putative [Bodo saltans]|eukprot:CUI15116.1 Hypothetical protein, putative [Bodo saltans]